MKKIVLPTTADIIKHYRSVLRINDKQKICCNPIFPHKEVPHEIAIHSLSTLEPLNEIKIEKGSNILDIGCGPGADCFLAAERTGKTGNVVGLDIVDKFIQRANELAKKYNYENVLFMKKDNVRFPFAFMHFHLVIMNYSFYLFPGKGKLLKDVYEALRPKGTLIVADSFKPKNVDFSNSKDSWFYSAASAVSFGEFKRMAAKAGFKEILFKQANLPDMPSDDILGYAICQKS